MTTEIPKKLRKKFSIEERKSKLATQNADTSLAENY